MNKYELTLVLPGEVTDAKKKKVKDSIEKWVESTKGKVSKVDEWGKIKLVQALKKKSDGDFLHFKIELDASAVKTLNQKLKRDEDIVRYLLVKV